MTLIEAVKATYAVIGQSMTDTELAMVVSDLSLYPADGVLAALARCRRELKRITLADILARLPGGHPGVEEAWALVSKALGNEAVSIVWTDEMREAMGVAMALADDAVAARMAFKEVYTRAVSESRAAGCRPQWTVSLGADPHGRALAQHEAANLNRAVSGLPTLSSSVVALPGPDGDGIGMPDEVRALVDRIGQRIPAKATA